jgi:hypothetical protein
MQTMWPALKAMLDNGKKKTAGRKKKARKKS